MVAFIKRLWHNEQNLQSAAGLLVVTMLLSNVLGFFRDVVLANSLPLDVLDTYYAAFRIPDFLFNLFILGAISSAFIPVYLETREKEGEKQAWQLAHNLLHVSLFVLLVLIALIYIFMPQFLQHFVPGFSPEKLADTLPLARILLFSPLFFALSYILGGIVNAHKKFFAYAVAPLMYNVSIIIGGALAPWLGVQGVAWAVVAGALLHGLVQLPTLIGLGYRYRFFLQLRDKNLLRVYGLMIPRAISLGMTQIIFLVFTRIGSGLPSGAISIFTLTNNLQTAPIAIFAASIATAAFPMLGSASSEGDNARFRSLLTDSLRGMFFYIIPSMALLWVLRAHLIRLYLALNHQTWEDTVRAITTFQWFILALAAQGFILILVRAFYAKQNTRHPMVVSLITGVFTILLAWYLGQTVGDVSALSLAFALGVTIEALCLFLIFRWLYRNLIDIAAVARTIAISTVLAIISGLLARFILFVVSEGVEGVVIGFGTAHVVPLFGAAFSAGILGLGLYIGLSLILQRSELLWIVPKRALRSSPMVSPEVLAREEAV